MAASALPTRPLPVPSCLPAKRARRMPTEKQGLLAKREGMGALLPSQNVRNRREKGRQTTAKLLLPHCLPHTYLFHRKAPAGTFNLPSWPRRASPLSLWNRCRDNAIMYGKKKRRDRRRRRFTHHQAGIFSSSWRWRRLPHNGSK